MHDTIDGCSRFKSQINIYGPCKDENGIWVSRQLLHQIPSFSLAQEFMFTVEMPQQAAKDFLKLSTYFQIEIEGKNILEGAGIWYIQKKTEMIKIKFALDTRHGGTLSIHSDDITPDNERSKSIIIHQAL